MCPQRACFKRCIVTLVLHLFGFSPVYVFKCVLKLPSQEDALSHCLHLFDFSLLCVIKCVLKALAWTDAKSHWLHLLDFSPLCIFKRVIKWPAWEETKSHSLHLFTVWLIYSLPLLNLFQTFLLFKVNKVKVKLHIKHGSFNWKIPNNWVKCAYRQVRRKHKKVWNEWLELGIR